MNREWLESPDGTLVYGGVIIDLFEDHAWLVGVFQAASAEGDTLGYKPLDRGCLVALQIDTATGAVHQLSVEDAYSRASGMEHVWSSGRDCVQASSSTSQ